MTARPTAFTGAAIHDGTTLHRDKALLVTGDTARLTTPDRLPEGCTVTRLDGGTILPGFVDLQLNGGGGVMFNHAPDLDTLHTIAEAHARCGSAAILPTLITDTPARTRAAIDAVSQAIDARIPGIVGIHLEGPHLSVARKGAHDPALIRRMEPDDLALLLSAAERLPNVLVTVAPETTDTAQIRALANAGITVALGHTDADFDTCMAAFDAGARAVTHLFNAMSQLGNREPGLVGATLARGDVHAGLIADGIHVHPATMRAALAAKTGPGAIFLVTDAMATAGSEIDRFTLNGREVLRRDHRLTLADGTLAGADLTLTRALQVMTRDVGEPLEAAIRRATTGPAALLRDPGSFGTLAQGAASLLYLAADGTSHRPLLAAAAPERRSA